MATSGTTPGNGQATVDNPSITNNANTPNNIVNTNKSTLPTRDIYSININDYNSSSHLYPISTPNASNRPLPPIRIQKVNQPPKNGFKFNHSFLIIPIVAFIVIAIAAITCGVIFGILYQPEKADKNTFSINDIPKNSDESSSTTANTPNNATISRSGIFFLN